VLNEEVNTTPRQRDRHLNRVSRITRWLVVAAAGATGLFTFLLARPQPSAAKATANASGSTAAGSTATTAGSSSAKSSGKSSGKTSSAPKAAPAPKRATRAPQASSGGS